MDDDPFDVPTNEPLSETVVFELRNHAEAERLTERLRPRWFTGIYDFDEAALVAVELRPEEGDLAVLLRAVKLWAVDSAIGSLPFHVDDRTYMLESGSALWAA